MVSKSTRAITQIAASYNFQSYFDSALLHNALQLQSPGDPIVASTKQQAQSGGVGVGVHPMSDVPVSFRFRGGTADSAALIVAPGQVFQVGSFETFEFGLPFGWLGGGNALIYVLHHDGANLDFGGGGRSPLVCQRSRFIIDSVAAMTSRLNWPRTFPWPSAARGTAGVSPQGGTALLDFEPEIAVLRLRSALAVPATVTMVWRGVDDLDLTGATPPVLTLTDFSTADVAFPSVLAASGAFPVVTLPPEIHRLGSSAGGINFVVPAGDPLIGSFIDVVRYCRLS
jgi:hypothetical protein